MNTRHLRLALGLVSTLGVLCACRGDVKKDQLSGPIGPGAGGPVPPVGAVENAEIHRPDGTLIGGFSYDGGFFALLTPDPAQTGILAGADPGTGVLQIPITHISGRPDTPCRFSAAVLARDGGFEIGDAGFRKNDQGQQLYQVNLQRPGAYAILFCAKLRDNAGSQFGIFADSPDKVSWLQAYAVINSIHAE
jgi:hypothetical protein